MVLSDSGVRDLRAVGAELLFQPCRFDGPRVRLRNPFTGKDEELIQNEISAAEADAVRALIVSACGAPGVDMEGGAAERFVFRDDDGASAEIYVDRLVLGCMFEVSGRGMTRSLANLLFDVLVAGNWTLGDGSDAWVVAANPDAVRSAPADFGEVKIVSSPEALGALFAPGFGADAGHPPRTT